MSIRGPVVALATLFLLTGCGSGIKGCSRLLETPAVFKGGSVAKEVPASKSFEFSPRRTSDDLGAATHDRPHEGTGHKLTEEALKHLIEDAAKHRDNDKKRDDDRPKN